MADKPIAFSAPMVLALLAGRKFETRRVVHTPEDATVRLMNDRWWWTNSDGGGRLKTFAVGDLLYVREEIRAWRTGPYKYVRHAADQHCTFMEWPPEWKRDAARPMHMFKRFSRMTLPVSGVRVERLHDITQEGAIAEGIERVTYEQCIHEHGGSTFDPAQAGMYGWRNYDKSDPTHLIPFHHDKAVLSYQSLWNSINGAGSWDLNPWVCVISWPKVIHQNVDKIQS